MNIIKKVFIPKNFIVMHKILEFLTKKRSLQQKNNIPLKDACFKIDDIKDSLKMSYEEVDLALNVLYENKDVEVIPVGNGVKLNDYVISKIGISNFSSGKYLHDGLLLYSQIFNNFSSGFFQIIIGIIAIWTIFQNSNIDKYTKKIDDEMNKIKIENTKFKNDILKLENNFYYKK